MGAVALTYQSGDIFIPNVNFQIPFDCAALTGFIGPGIATIVTSVGVQTNELQQFFVGFDDLITYLWYGKSLGAITIGGIMFSDCTGNISQLNSFYSTVGPLRGQMVTLSMGGYSFSGPVATSTIQLTNEPDTMAYFTIGMSMTTHTLPSGGNSDGSGGPALGFNSGAGELGGNNL